MKPCLMSYKCYYYFASKYFIYRELQASKYWFITYVWSKVDVFFTQCRYCMYTDSQKHESALLHSLLKPRLSRGHKIPCCGFPIVSNKCWNFSLFGFAISLDLISFLVLWIFLVIWIWRNVYASVVLRFTVNFRHFVEFHKCHGITSI